MHRWRQEASIALLKRCSPSSSFTNERLLQPCNCGTAVLIAPGGVTGLGAGAGAAALNKAGASWASWNW
jgi:hypothetical protein